MIGLWGAPMRYLIVILALLAIAPAKAATAEPPASSCLKFDPTIDAGCVLLPHAEAFPELCSRGYALPAAAACTKVIESGPAEFRVWAYFFRALSYNYVHRFDDAIRDYSVVVAEKPDFVAGWVWRGLEYITLKKYDLARKDIEHAKALDTNRFDVLRAQSLLEFGTGDKQGAMATIQIALALTPKTADRYYDRGFFYLKYIKNDEAAQADFSAALELDPGHADALLTRSEIYARGGRMDLAEQDCNAAVAQKLPPKDIHFCFGMMYFIANRYPDALREFRAVLVDRPDMDYVWTDCASMELLSGKYAEAVTDLDQAIAVNPAETASYINRGIAHRHLGQIDLALADYSKALEIDPHNLNAYINRGALYLAIKDFERAEADFTKALELQPDNANAKRGLYHAQHKISLPPGMSSTVVH